MSHKLERQYQLQAQKRHEESLKLDYYKRTARYFERESEVAKQFSAWSMHGTNSYADRLEKENRAGKLETRRNELKQLLAEEDKMHEHELDEQNRIRRNPSSESLSLDELRQKLIEKKAEQSLYYPSSCRRPMSHASSSSGSIEKLESRSSSDLGARPTSGDSQKHIRHSSLERDSCHTNPGDRKSEQNYGPTRDSPNSPEATQQNLRYSAHPFARSLQNTNLAHNYNQEGGIDLLDPEYLSNLTLNSPNSSPVHVRNNSRCNYDENSQEKISSQGECKSDAQKNTESVHDQAEHFKIDNEWVPQEAETVDFRPRHGPSWQNQPTPSQVPHQPETQHWIAAVSKTPFLSEAEFHLFNDEEMSCSQNNQSNDIQYKERDMSVQMYRYLKHHDLKRNILDLCKREHMYVTKNCFEEALRLREMRNALILLRNKNLYENFELYIPDQTRQIGLSSIEARQALRNNREKMSNSHMYSDEARDTWKKWVQEDDNIARTEKNAMRDLLSIKLEEEWNDLAHRDKSRMTELYDKVMTKSDLQSEHILAETIRTANNRQKQRKASEH